MQFVGSQDELVKEIGRRVKEAREAAEMTKMQLAAFAGVSITTICHIEDGKHGPKVLIVYKVAKALNVPAHSLLPEQWEQIESAPVRKIVQEVEQNSNAPRIVGGDEEEDVNDGTDQG